MQVGKIQKTDRMGAIPQKGGVFFRVWAPHADDVHVAGTFNDWSETAHPLVHEVDGYWFVDVPGAKAGDEYRYLIRNGDLVLWRIDPYSRAVTHSNGNSIVEAIPPNPGTRDEGSAFGEGRATVGQRSPNARPAAGGEPAFQPPPWNEMVIYEMHVGTFARGKHMVEHNYEVAKRYFSYAVLRRRLQTLLINVMGLD